MIKSLFASLLAKILGVTFAATAAAGGLAAAGALPAPAQQAVSQISSTVGVNIPSTHVRTEVAAEAADAHESPTSTVKDHEDPTSTVKDQEASEVTSTVAVGEKEDSDTNHGHCVSFAAHAASILGLSGSAKGEFISAVARDDSAVSAKVAEGGKPDAVCLSALARAKVSATVSGNSGENHGESHGEADDHAGTAGVHGNSHRDATSKRGND
jgi:hypothetical protein